MRYLVSLFRYGRREGGQAGVRPPWGESAPTGRPGRGPAALGRECPYWTAAVFMEVFMASVFSAAFLWVTVPATSSLPMDSAGVQ